MKHVMVVHGKIGTLLQCPAVLAARPSPPLPPFVSNAIIRSAFPLFHASNASNHTQPSCHPAWHPMAVHILPPQPHRVGKVHQAICSTGIAKDMNENFYARPSNAQGEGRGAQ